MKSLCALLLTVAYVAGICAQEGSAADPFAGIATRTRDWPGLMPADALRPLEPAAQALLSAMQQHDAAAIAAQRDLLVAAMGKHAGEPEERPRYGVPLDASEPSIDRVLQAWEASSRRSRGRRGWETAADRVSKGAAPERLRTSVRVARANLQLYDAGVSDAERKLREARQAFGYMLTVQARSGVFGYPFDPAATTGLRSAAARFAEEARRRGRSVVQKGWIVDDLDTGALNFDNGVVGAGLLHAWLATGDLRYVDAARRAGVWAMDRPYVTNFNYNGFNGLLLARLYRVTGEARYLARAREIFDFAVLPGQLPNGRWFDQHNAKIQYHAILLSQLIEYWLALRQAGDDIAAARVQDAVTRGLDNLAAEVTTFGSSNPHELLALDALAIGSMVFGARETWTRAMNVDVNFLLDVFARKLETQGMPVPDALAAYILFRKGPGPQATGADIAIGPLAQWPRPKIRVDL